MPFLERKYTENQHERQDFICLVSQFFQIEIKTSSFTMDMNYGYENKFFRSIQCPQTVILTDFFVSGGVEGGHIDAETVADVAFYHALIGFVDLLDRNHLDVRDDVMPAAVIEHLLRLRDAADEGACEAFAPHDD